MQLASVWIHILYRINIALIQNIKIPSNKKNQKVSIYVAIHSSHAPHYKTIASRSSKPYLVKVLTKLHPKASSIRLNKLSKNFNNERQVNILIAHC